jgi:uncharacterized protein (UPF0218 family)
LFNVPKLLLGEPQRKRLKAPLGQLVSGSVSECTQALRSAQQNEKPRLLILVGDTISRNAIESGVKPDIMIIDQKEKRGRALGFTHGKRRVFRATNEPATIDLLAWQAVAEAIKGGDAAVVIDGEEDLLTLVAIEAAPNGCIVAYGQPGEGIVLVRVTEEKKSEIQQIIDEMEKVD